VLVNHVLIFLYAVEYPDESGRFVFIIGRKAAHGKSGIRDSRGRGTTQTSSYHSATAAELF
jgi:hypothetical protein